ncbi:hypothetical protein, conserved [Plasmodium gonderi]|uniref:CHY-type domain-containing protein n=1 Tax=Plasmodium gonderi TaxID=77519 RepID=A0A1Y1JFD8_PLAGO|nr:hypothetical protein, conserved [Plasmodium gonderi]GAW80368.1 hypothetical protein, conserved [Plasmodium gonderi]
MGEITAHIFTSKKKKTDYNDNGNSDGNDHDDEKRTNAAHEGEKNFLNMNNKYAKSYVTQNDYNYDYVMDECNKGKNFYLKNEKKCFYEGGKNNKMDYVHSFGKYNCLTNRKEREEYGKNVTSNDKMHVNMDSNMDGYMSDSMNDNIKQSTHSGHNLKGSLSKKDDQIYINVNRGVSRTNKSTATSGNENSYANMNECNKGYFQRARNYYSNSKVGMKYGNLNYYNNSDYVKREMVDHFKNPEDAYSGQYGRSTRNNDQSRNYQKESCRRERADRFHYYNNQRNDRAPERSERHTDEDTYRGGHRFRMSHSIKPSHTSGMNKSYSNYYQKREGTCKNNYNGKSANNSSNHINSNNKISRSNGNNRSNNSNDAYMKGMQNDLGKIRTDESESKCEENFLHTNEPQPSERNVIHQFNQKNEKSEEHFGHSNNCENNGIISSISCNNYLNKSNSFNTDINVSNMASVKNENKNSQNGQDDVHTDTRSNGAMGAPNDEENSQGAKKNLRENDSSNNETPNGNMNQKDNLLTGGDEVTNEKMKKMKREEEKKKVMNWKLEEQTLLEEGLRVFKDLKNCPEKWKKVSEIVKTKSPDDCLKRFLYCRFIVMKEKQKIEKEKEEEMRRKQEEELRQEQERQNKSNEQSEECINNPNDEELDQDIDSDDMNINNNTNITGKSLILNNTQIKNISLYKAVMMKLQLVCNRCCNTFDVTTTSKDSPQLVCTCANCNNSVVVEVYRNICFMENNCVCVLKFNQCSLMDLLSTDFSVNCESCGRKSILKNVTSGKEIYINCQKCFTKLEFRYRDFSFDEIANANNAAIKKIDEMINKLFTKKKSTKKAIAAPNNLKIEKCKNVIKVNNIEVKDGACKHFKKSHRLFKFPCCNKIFPCPTCHDLNSNHECGIATRVICGFCFREFNDDEECICQRDKKTKKGGNFWEGGKGCRNAITLSKNDSKKYKLLNRQTVQKKKKK